MMNRRHGRRGERGSTMVIVMAIIVALLSAGAVALYLQVGDTRATGVLRQARDALYCAEAGLAAGRDEFQRNYDWRSLLAIDPDDSPMSNYPLTGDYDGDGEPDYRVWIEDNHDEEPPGHDPDFDNDETVFIVSECTRFPETPRQVKALVSFAEGGSVYRNQAGHGQGNTGNAN